MLLLLMVMMLLVLTTQEQVLGRVLLRLGRPLVGKHMLLELLSLGLFLELLRPRVDRDGCGGRDVDFVRHLF